MTNSLLWTPLLFGLLGLFLPTAGGRLVGGAGDGGDAGAGDRAARRLRLGRRRPAGHRRRRVDPRARRRLQPRRRRPQRLPDPADRGAVAGRDGLRRLPRAGAPPPLLPDDAARRDGDAGRLPRPGPAPLRPLLRPDAGAVLLPLRRLGERPRGRPDGLGGDAEDDRLHADRLAADAGRGDRDGGDLRRRRPAHLLDRRAAAAAASARAASAGSSGSSPPPSWSRCPPSCCTAGCRTPTAPRRCRRWRSSPGCWPRSAPTASCASYCRSSPTRRSSSRRWSW